MATYYTGIGSRQTPQKIMWLMEEFAREMARLQLVLRSGAAEGADQAFERGCNYNAGDKEVYIPWNGFQERREDVRTFLPLPEAGDLAAKVHPHYRAASAPVKLLISRNMHQVLGQDLLTPSKFVICWTPDGCTSHLSYQPKNTGGTGSAIALASYQDIPVFNLYHPEHLWDAYLLAKG